jgi:hypothetical protein
LRGTSIVRQRQLNVSTLNRRPPSRGLSPETHAIASAACSAPTIPLTPAITPAS